MAEKRFIECEALKEQLHKRLKNPVIISWLYSIIEDTPAADVVEVKHGKWEEVKYIEGCLNPYKHTCSCCGKSYFDNNSNNYPFCPLCGAKMDGERRSE